MHVEHPRTRVRDRPHDVRARSDRVPDVDAQSHPAIHVAHVFQGVIGRREPFVLRAVIVDRDLDVVLLGEPLDARQDRHVGVRGDQGHAGRLGVREVLPHVCVAVLLEGDHAAAHDAQARALDFTPRRGHFVPRQLVGQVHGL